MNREEIKKEVMKEISGMGNPQHIKKTDLFCTRDAIDRTITKTRSTTVSEMIEMVEGMITNSKKIIQSLWDTMKEPSKKCIIGKHKLTEGESGNITLKEYDFVTEHDRQHISEICERKRFISELEELKAAMKLKEGT